MAGPDDGWQTVMPTSQAGIERLSRSQVETYERRILREWESSRGHWSGIGKHTSDLEFAEAKKVHTRFKPAVDRVLGTGTFGVVEKVHYTHQNRTVCVARKWIQYRRGRTNKLLREEAKVMEKLDHEHIVKLIGSYAVRHNELYLLLWPVAVCNLDAFCGDIDALRTKQGDRNDIIRRLEGLDLRDMSALDRRPDQPSAQGSAKRTNCPLNYLQQIMGCISQAVTFCHNTHIRHLDLKPSNILLSPGRVYLADFGIARDVDGRDHTMTMGPQGTPKWRAPEICDHDDEWSMNKADIYSLGLVLLNIATALYAPNMAEFDDLLDDLNPKSRAAKLNSYHENLRANALTSQDVRDSEAWTFSPKHILNLTKRMLSSTPAERPRAEQVNSELVELGGIEQIYHAPCCKRSSRFVTDLMDKRYKVVAEERSRLAEKNQEMTRRVQVLEAKDETYESRIRNEQKKLVDSMAHLQEQLEKERKERRRLEALVADMQHHAGGRRKAMHPPGIPRPERTISAEGPPGHSIPTAPALMMRARPQTHPLPHKNGSYHNSYNSNSKPPTPGTVAIHAPQPVHPASPNTTRATPPVRRPSLFPPASPLPNGPSTPSPGPATPASAIAAAGFPLRSRGSGSRLPRAVHPSTPMRSGTPTTLTRDPSLTDSTQFSMASSTFSRFSGESSVSALATTTSGAGTPALGASPDERNFKSDAAAAALDESRAGLDIRDSADDATTAVPLDDGFGLGLDVTLNDGPTLSDINSVQDTASVMSGPAASTKTGTMSPILTGSALSSPRTARAELDPAGGIVKVPSLQTAKSWADVARRERR